MSVLKFICTGCGACCRRAGQVPNFPEPLNEDGSCVHLTAMNTCSIYEKRPEICKVSKLFETMGRDMEMSRKQFYIYNNQLCNRWIKEENLGDEYLIDISQYDSMEQ